MAVKSTAVCLLASDGFEGSLTDDPPAEREVEAEAQKLAPEAANRRGGQVYSSECIPDP